MKKLLKNKFIWLGAAAVIVIILITLLSTRQDGATKEQARNIAKMLQAENITILYLTVVGNSYEITYPAEAAVGRFDDAILYDWATIYAVAADHNCDTVSIITTLDGERIEKQTASCAAVRALARGVLTEKEFWMLVDHESVSGTA